MEGDLAILTLNRPEKRNAISQEMVEELLAALGALETGPARVVIITGEGKAFCSGMDLDALQGSGGATGGRKSRGRAAHGELFRRLWSLS